MKEIVIPTSVTKIGGHTFENCESLETLRLPSSLTNAGLPSKYTSTATDGVTSEGVGTIVEGCTSLKSIEIPNTLDNIYSSYIHTGSDDLDIYYLGSEADWNSKYEDTNDMDNVPFITFWVAKPAPVNATYHFNTAMPDSTTDDGNTDDGNTGDGNTGDDNNTGGGTTTPEVAPTYTVTFNANSGTASATSFETDKDGKLSSLPTATRSGYTFNGWYLADGTKVTTSTVFDENTTVTAKWTLNSSSSGGSSSGGSSGGNYDYDDNDNSSSSNSSSSSSSTTKPTTTTTTAPTTTTTTPTTTTPSNTVTNTPIVAPAVSTTVTNTETKVDETTGNTVTTLTYENGTEVVKETTTSGNVTAEITGITEKTALTIPMETTPSITEVVVIVKADGTREIIKDTTLNDDGFRIILDSDAKIEIVDNTKVFRDIPANTWYEDSVKFVTSRELFNGMGDGVFAPEGTMTRAMIWTVLYNYQGDNSTNGTGGDWYADAQAWSVAFGVSDGTNPDDEMTREQLVTLLYRLGGEGATGGQYDKFADSGSVSSWAEDAMNWAVAEGIMNGSNGNLNPQANATRAEVSAIMMRFMGE